MKKYIIAFVAAISIITVHQTALSKDQAALSQGWLSKLWDNLDFFGIKRLDQPPFIDKDDVKETARIAEQDGQYLGRREMAFYTPLVIGAAYAGHKGLQAVRNWYRGPAKTMHNKLEHIKGLIKSDLAATERHIIHQKRSTHKDASSILDGLEETKAILLKLNNVFESNS